MTAAPIPKDGPDSDGARSHAVAIDAIREDLIRRSVVLPRPDHLDELRWAQEGFRPIQELDTARRRPK